ncbi:MAG: helix-turn-helix domain-containing protein [Archangium sp.]
MKQVTVETFLREPHGKWAGEGSLVVWCADATLGGAVMWGRPNIEEVERGLRMLDGYVALGPQAVVVLDARQIELDVDPLIDVSTWCLSNRFGLHERLKLQVGLTRAGLAGTYPELRPTLTHPIEVFLDERAAYERVAGERGAALAKEISECVEQVRDVAPQVVKLRAMLRESAGNLSVGEAARALALSPRSLQRALSEANTSFREELAASRSQSATELLDTTTGSLAVVARQMGISVGTLMSTVRRSVGATPSEYRKRRRRS